MRALTSPLSGSASLVVPGTTSLVVPGATSCVVPGATSRVVPGATSLVLLAYNLQICYLRVAYSGHTCRWLTLDIPAGAGGLLLTNLRVAYSGHTCGDLRPFF